MSIPDAHPASQPVDDVPAAVRDAADPGAALDAVVHAFAADSGTLHFLHADGMLHLSALHGPMPPPVLEKVRVIPVGKGMAGVCAELNEPVTWCNLNRDNSGVVQASARSTGLAGSIVIPVRIGARLVGTLGIANRAERTFTEAETARLCACAASLGRFAPAH
jgi:signal transduction protein with GAF and PtsI domain